MATNDDMYNFERYSDIPGRALLQSAINLLGQFLNFDNQIFTESGYSKDWRGLAELMGYTQPAKIQTFERSPNQTNALIRDWQTQARSNLKQLFEFLNEIERRDVIEDPNFRKAVEKSIARYKEELEENENEFGGNENDAIIPDIAMEHDENDRPLRRHRERNVDETNTMTTDDAVTGKRTMYDAFVSYSYKDVGFVKELISQLEGQYGMKLCVFHRDVLGGTSKHTVCAALIEQRCKRTILVLSPNFINSPVCEFQCRFAHYLSPGAKSKKLVPVLIKECQVPQILCPVSKIDYTKPDLQEWFWPRLHATLKSPLDEIYPSSQDMNKLILTDSQSSEIDFDSSSSSSACISVVPSSSSSSTQLPVIHSSSSSSSNNPMCSGNSEMSSSGSDSQNIQNPEVSSQSASVTQVRTHPYLRQRSKSEGIPVNSDRVSTHSLGDSMDRLDFNCDSDESDKKKSKRKESSQWQLKKKLTSLWGKKNKKVQTASAKNEQSMIEMNDDFRSLPAVLNRDSERSRAERGGVFQNHRVVTAVIETQTGANVTQYSDAGTVSREGTTNSVENNAQNELVRSSCETSSQHATTPNTSGISSDDTVNLISGCSSNQDMFRRNVSDTSTQDSLRQNCSETSKQGTLRQNYIDSGTSSQGTLGQDFRDTSKHGILRRNSGGTNKQDAVGQNSSDSSKQKRCSTSDSRSTIRQSSGDTSMQDTVAPGEQVWL